MDEKGKKICEIRTPGYKAIIISGIVLISTLIFAYIKGILDIEFLFGTGGLIAVVAFVNIYKESLKKVIIYENSILVNGKETKFRDIEIIKLMKKDYKIGVQIKTSAFGRTNKIKDENYLQMEFYDGNIDGFFVSNYSLKQIRTIINCIKEYSNCEVSQANEFLDIAEEDEKKDIKMSIIAIVILIIIAVIFITKISNNFKNLGA